MQHFLTVGQQVLMLFVLVGVGFLCGKFHVFGERAAKGMADIVLFIVTPCVLIQAFQRDRQPDLARNALLALLIVFAIHAVSIAVVTLLFRDRDEKRRRVLRLGAVFSNAGYMALPLQQAVLGSEGVFYGAAYVAVFNIVLWSWGLLEASGDRRSIRATKLILNPGVIGVTIGAVLFFTSFRLPPIINGPMAHLASLNTPLPMLIVGYHLSRANVLSVFKDGRALLSIALRVVAIPLVTLGVLYVCGVRGVLLQSIVIAASAPVAASTSMFAAKYDCDVSLSVNLVSLSTVLSVLTMPLIVGLAGMLA